MGNGGGERGEGGFNYRVAGEMFIHQSLKSGFGGGGAGAIWEFHMPYGIRVEFLLYNFGQESR